MKSICFFKSTPLYRKFLILLAIKNNSNITQRDIANDLKISVAMVNMYLNEYEKDGFIKRVYTTIKNVKYILTDRGETQRKLLNIQYLESALDVYNDAKDDCYKFFDSIIVKGYRDILFYGAGEVAEIMLSVINNDASIVINVLGIVDDDESKQGKILMNKTIISLYEAIYMDYDGILISTYTNSKKIYDKLIKLNVNENKIIQFFEKENS